MKTASIRMASILLAALTVLPCAVSCGGNSDEDSPAVTDNIPGTNTVEDSAAVETADRGVSRPLYRLYAAAERLCLRQTLSETFERRLRRHPSGRQL